MPEIDLSDDFEKRDISTKQIIRRGNSDIRGKTRKWLHACISSSENVQILPPVGYFDFLLLMKNCRLILTDSGGLQEEATAPPTRKTVLVLRLSTERLEAVEAGFEKVVGTERDNILTAVTEILEEKVKLLIKSPFGDGDAGEKIAQIVKKELT